MVVVVAVSAHQSGIGAEGGSSQQPASYLGTKKCSSILLGYSSIRINYVS